MKKYTRLVVGIALLVTFNSYEANAADFYYYCNISFGQNPVNPGTPAPWVTAHIADASPGTVLVTISNSASLSHTMKLDEMDFNLNPSLNSGSLSFNLADSTGGNGFSLPT